jgi:hypothetical protein
LGTWAGVVELYILKISLIAKEEIDLIRQLHLSAIALGALQM